MRKGNYITTYCGINFYPLDPRNEEIIDMDIAHALSMICRGNGHLKHFYSVGQHSINCALEAKQRHLSKKVQQACLLHDASEAYLSDITRPVKSLLPEYLRIEEGLQNVLYSHYNVLNLSDDEWAAVKDIDDNMLKMEMNTLFNTDTVLVHNLLSQPNLEIRNMVQVRDEFIEILKSFDIINIGLL